MPIKLSTPLSKVQYIPIRENAETINQFYAFMKNNNSSERHIVNNLKVILNFDGYFRHSKAFADIGKEEKNCSNEYQHGM